MTPTPQENNSNDEITKYSKTEHISIPIGSGRGLINMSNTCYMNSALQLLVHTSGLSLYFMSDNYKDDLNSNKSECYLAHSWKLFLDNYYNTSNSSPLCPTAVHAIVNILAHNRDLHLYRLGNQNDIHEFIQFILDTMHEALCYPIKVNIKGTVRSTLDRLTLNGHKQWALFFREQYSIIVDLFGCQLLSTLICPDCNTRSTSFTPEYCITLPIPPKKKGQKGPIDLHECFAKFIEPEIMDKDNLYTCEKCKEKKAATKSIALWRTPKKLIILLKRFRSHGQHAAKINDMVVYPHKLDISQYCKSFDGMNKSQYQLYSVCNHTGVTGGGHYFAYCKDSDGKWRQYNDSHVSDISDDKVITKDAYCLAYERI